MICRESGINGYDANAERAERLLPATTSDPSKTYVYIEKTSSGYYYHSNFVTPGNGFEYPTKIASDHLIDVQQAFYNIRFAGGSDEAGQHEAIETYRNDVHVYLDRSLFSQGGYPLVDVKDARNVAIVNDRQ
jgi:hypothetical protein